MRTRLGRRPDPPLTLIQRPRHRPEPLTDRTLIDHRTRDSTSRTPILHLITSRALTVGIDHDTAQFAVNSIRAWWEHLGRERYPNATRLQITADCGGSNANRTKLWKVELQKLADDTSLEIAVCPFPPGTSKWNRIEHRLFSFITMNWRGKPLVSLETIINLIGATTTRSGLEVYARLDDGAYPDKIKVPDSEIKAVNLHGDEFHPEWN